MSDCNHEDDGEGTCLGCGHPMPADNKPGTLAQPLKPPKEKVTYKETYKKGYCKFVAASIPKFVHLSFGCKPVDCYLMAAGCVTRGEEQLEFQDIRVYFTV